jgi:4-amino-4-deoxy-L-arabinose transferase-like glycosyltransferase
LRIPRLGLFLFWLAAISLFCGFLFFYRLDARDLWSSHEGRAAQNAQSMVGDGYWGVPRLLDQQFDLQKPPLYYWLVSLVARARGGIVDAWAVRLPAALSALMTVLLVLGFAWRQGQGRAGVIAAILLATAVHFTWMARIGRIDMPLTLVISAALLAFYRGIQGEGKVWPWFLLGYVALAAGVLLKGPIGLVLPAAVLVAYVILESRVAGWSAARSLVLSLSWGIPLLALLVLPWFVWASGQTGGKLVRCFLWYHNIERAFGGSGGLRAHPWWFYAPRLTVDLLPWSPLIPLAAWSLFRHGRWRAEPVARFGLVWFAVMVLVLSCARFKRADYLLPAYPGAALLVGFALARRGETEAATKTSFRLQPALAGFASIVVIGALTGWQYQVDNVLPREEPARESRAFAAAIRRAAPAPQLVIFFRAEAHALAFHVGRPLNTVLEWENIDIWVKRPGEHYFVMPPDCVEAWPQHIPSARLEVLARNTDPAGGRHEHPLVLARSVPVP